MRFILILALFSIGVSAMANNIYFEAVQKNDIILLKEAIKEYPKEVNIKDSIGQTPLYLAVNLNRVDIAIALINAGANINAKATGIDSTPWLLAGSLGRTEILKDMVNKKPDFTILNYYGGNALIPACEKGYVDSVAVMVTTPGINLDHVNRLGWTCLLEVVMLGDGSKKYQDITTIILKAGANPTLADKNGVTPLEHAKQRNQTEVAKIIASYIK